MAGGARVEAFGVLRIRSTLRRDPDGETVRVGTWVMGRRGALEEKGETPRSRSKDLVVSSGQYLNIPKTDNMITPILLP